MSMEDEHLPAFLREKQSSKNASLTPSPASKTREEGPTLLAGNQAAEVTQPPLSKRS